MADLDAAIERYVATEIALDAKDISAVVRSREWVLTRIRNVIEADTNGPQLYAPEPFVYFGSYFKGTKVRDVDEFDILVVVDSNTGVFSVDGRAIGHGQGSQEPNRRYDQRFMKADGSGLSPAKLLGWLRSVVATVAAAHGGEAPELDGQAIMLRIASKDLCLDLVPAGVFSRLSDGSTFYNISKGSPVDAWRRTSPRLDVEQLEEVAEGKENFRNVIRVAKRIRDTYGLDVPSFAIETAIVRYGRTATWSSWVALELRYALRHLASALGAGTIPDPYEQAENLVAEVRDREGSAKLFRLVADYLETLESNTMSADELYEKVRSMFEADL